jgi:SAM-dependent methyltransferase
MNIYDATLKLKDYRYKDNPQLVKINGKIEMSGFSLLPILTYSNRIKKIMDYDRYTDNRVGNFLFDPDIKINHKKLKERYDKSDFILFDNLTPDRIDTKEYWNFLHKNFQYCDVCSYFSVTNLDAYFVVKGRLYNYLIDVIGIENFRNKKILEIGPGYGYLPKFLKENNIPHEYYCADIVKRFDHDNFIDVSGYSLSNITDKFDVVLMQDVIQHLGSTTFKQYTKEIKELLTDDGVLYIGSSVDKSDDIGGIFFGQTYNTMGLDNMKKHMVDDLNFVYDIKPIFVEHNSKRLKDANLLTYRKQIV